MIPGEEFYPALKKLVSMPEWKEYEKLLEERKKNLFDQFMTTEYDVLRDIRNRAQEVENIKAAVHQIISEVEASRK